ncbi:activator-dependent family glycosyltransferase [Amycolatopsis sp. cmx-11-12]|uniref:activator-dependent family glycosyltransferase n=1 Tax=Amycolatopsis sp. cmx-11-12 TaxID=2785795 RepID=UPI0039186447
MRVLFTTFAAKSHLYDMVPLAWALHTAGHEVRVASQPDLAEDITRASLTAVPVGEELNLDQVLQEDTSDEDPSLADLDIAENRPEMLTWDYVLRVFQWYSPVMFEGLAGEAVMDDIVEFAREWRPDLVIWDPMTFSGPVAARASGAAHARMLFGQDFIGRMRGHFMRLKLQQQPGNQQDPMAEWLDATMKRFNSSFAEEMVVGQWSIDSTPAWMRLPLDINYVPVRFVPYHGPVAVPEWLSERPARPRVCLTAGISGREVMGGDWVPIPQMLEAVADLDIDVVATLDASQLEAVKAIPDNVQLFDFFPLNVLMPTCSAVIHHGGAGAFGTALANAVPQLIIPNHIWDTVVKAEQFAERGAGLFLDPEGLTTDTLRSKLLRLLEDPSFADGAAQARDDFLATPSPNDIVPVLEELTAKHRVR